MIIPKFEFNYIWNSSSGLGDCLSIFNTNRLIWSPSPHYNVLRKYSSLNSLDKPIGNGLNVITIQEANFEFDGIDHLFNRVRLVSGLDPVTEPKAQLDLIKYNPVKNNIAFSFDTGPAAVSQQKLHNRARQLYPEHKSTIQAFINKHKDRYNFIQVGLNSFGFENVINKTNISLDETIQVLSQCQSYFGMHSGIMHLVAAIGIKSTIIINFPSIEFIRNKQVFEPMNNLQWEKQWLYPQNGILHEDEIGSEYEITIENLEHRIL